MGSPWLAHVKKTMAENPGKRLKDVLKLASKTYKKTKSVVKYAVTGKRTRKHRRRRTKRGGKKSSGSSGKRKRRRSSRGGSRKSRKGRK